jgi:hypothetical protein
MVIEMLDYCWLLTNRVVPGIDKGLYVCQAAFVKETDQLDGFLEDLVVLALLE